MSDEALWRRKQAPQQGQSPRGSRGWREQGAGAAGTSWVMELGDGARISQEPGVSRRGGLERTGRGHGLRQQVPQQHLSFTVSCLRGM